MESGEREQAVALGFMDAWSMPIKSVAGTILGTFGTYFHDRRTPTLKEKTGVERLTDDEIMRWVTVTQAVPIVRSKLWTIMHDPGMVSSVLPQLPPADAMPSNLIFPCPTGAILEPSQSTGRAMPVAFL